MISVDKIVKAINNLNDPTSFEVIKTIISVITSLITCWVAYLTYKLQKKVKENDDANRKILEVNHASNVYYFLNDIISKMSDIEFNYNSFDTVVVEGDKYMDDINFLRVKYISNEEFKLLRDLFILYNGIRTECEINYSNFKLLYKKIIDVNISPYDILKYKENNNLDYVISILVFSILKKLEHILNYETKIIDKNIKTVFNKNKICIIKNYDKGYYLENKNGNISGIIKRYEAVFHYNRSSIMITSEMIYDGSIKNNKYDGYGTYYYYTGENGFNGKINSGDLERKDINLDVIAQKIKEELKSESNDGYFEAIFEGKFSNGKIVEGILKYKLNSQSEEKQLKITKET